MAFTASQDYFSLEVKVNLGLSFELDQCFLQRQSHLNISQTLFHSIDFCLPDIQKG